MKKTQNTTESDTLDGNAKETDKQSSSELIERKGINGTPFEAVRHDKKWFIGFGKYKISREMQTEQDCIEECKNPQWNTFLNVIQAMIDMNEKYKRIPLEDPNQLKLDA